MTTPVSPTNAVTLVGVTLASGQSLQVQGQDEASHFVATRDKYLAENRFTDVTDLQDLDQLLMMELMVHRWSQWTSSGKDYDGNVIDDDAFIKPLREYTAQIGNLKQRMGLNRSEREKAEHESVGGYLVQLQQRAKEFGVHRETQLGKALELVNQLSALIGAFDRADEEEREHIGIMSEVDLLDWVREVMLPEFREIDAHFRANKQRFWVGTL